MRRPQGWREHGVGKFVGGQGSEVDMQELNSEGPGASGLSAWPLTFPVIRLRISVALSDPCSVRLHVAVLRACFVVSVVYLSPLLP